MILILGDSNYRNTLDIHGERLSLAVKEKINFVMITSNESLKTQLQSANNYKIICLAAPMNEIANRVKNGGKGRGRDETIKIVVDEQNKMINESANTEGRLGTIHLILPPFLRQDPAWMEERLKWTIFNLRDRISENSPWNVGIGNPINVVAEDLMPDKVHLNANGMEKLFKGLESDLKKCKENLGEGVEALSQDWASQVTDELMNEPPTPGSMRKRARDDPESDEEEEEEEVTPKVTKKAKKDSAGDKMDKMLSLMQEMKEENALARTGFGDLKDKVEITDKKVDGLKLEFDGIKGDIARDTELTAEMLENIDGLENENLRTTVIIRKLKAEKTVPKDKAELRKYIQDLARVLVTKVVNNATAAKGVKYASSLYSFVDPTKKDNREGLVPPFRICFNSRDVAVEFREKAVKMAKEGMPRRTFGENQDEWMDEGNGGNQQPAQGAPAQGAPAQGAPAQGAVTNVCQGAYFSYYQTAATRFRITLMWAVADGLKTKSKQVWVSQGNKPTLQVKEGGKVTKSLSFVQTMGEYSDKINKKTLDDVKKAATKLFAGHLEKTFIVIKD